jgi:branched-subunit amino acid aminotransferase/4-amino-4-deoxychorismate lyase
MPEPLAYLNGTFLPLSQAGLSVLDPGVVQGATVTERLRTFGHRLFRVDEHLERLRRSLVATEIGPPALVEGLRDIAGRVVDENTRTLPPEHDLGLVILITAGIADPTVCLHPVPLSAQTWLRRYEQGVHLVTPARRHIPPDTLDPRIKHRSRLHWFLADREVRARDPEAMALLRNHAGHLTETSSGNLLILEGTALRVAPRRDVLYGISEAVVRELAVQRGIAVHECALTDELLTRANEAFVSSTSFCLFPVTRFNGVPVGSGRPGPMFRRLISDWSTLVGVDIVEQARSSDTIPPERP